MLPPGQGKPPGVLGAQLVVCTVRSDGLMISKVTNLVKTLICISAIDFELRNLAGKLLNEPGKPPRECIVIRVQRDVEIGNARAVLVNSKLGFAPDA